MILGKLPHLAVPHFPFQSNGNDMNSSFKVLLQTNSHVKGSEGRQGDTHSYNESYYNELFCTDLRVSLENITRREDSAVSKSL